MTAPKKRIRDAAGTRKRILNAARIEFARYGLGGARVDTIAERSRSNKRMIYHYFDSKEKLFQRVLEDTYQSIREAETKLDLDRLEPRQALEELVRFTWAYYLAHPELIRLVNSENLHRARHIKGSDTIRQGGLRLIDMTQKLLERGADQGVFRKNIDAVNLSITIAAIGYYYLTNCYTSSILFGTDLLADEMKDQRLQFNIDTITRLVCLD